MSRIGPTPFDKRLLQITPGNVPGCEKQVNTAPNHVAYRPRIRELEALVEARYEARKL